MPNTDYNFGARLLHRLALGVPLLAKMSLEIDSIGAAPPPSRSDRKHVFISGLARAGTTVLMRAFHASGHFRSLTYRDMPFVLMPRLSKKLFGNFYTQGAAQDRAHGDGITVDFDSPEAFEEVFWRVFSGERYIFDDCLRPCTVDQETIEQFRAYVGNVIASAEHATQQQYLSKNNNNILRLGAIRAAFPTALIIIPFRDPSQQALSLWQQHAKFSARGKDDPFSVQYMKWLGHYEFGVGHKPFRFADLAAPARAPYAPTSVNYWLNIWIDSYQHLLLTAPADAVFVSFERLCAAPGASLQQLCGMAGLPADAAAMGEAIRLPKQHRVDGLDTDLLARAAAIHARLSERALA